MNGDPALLLELKTLLLIDNNTDNIASFLNKNGRFFREHHIQDDITNDTVLISPSTERSILINKQISVWSNVSKSHIEITFDQLHNCQMYDYSKDIKVLRTAVHAPIEESHSLTTSTRSNPILRARIPVVTLYPKVEEITEKVPVIPVTIAPKKSKLKSVGIVFVMTLTFLVVIFVIRVIIKKIK
jgi:hypothetical protein